MSEKWKQTQERTFTNWCNDRLRGHLKVPKNQITSLATDLKDGLLLIELLEKLAAPKTVGKYNKTPKIKAQCVENIATALRFVSEQGIKLVNIGPEDIYEGNLKLILGLIWSLILKYQIKSSGRGLSTKKAMLQWINVLIGMYRIENFSTDWNDGRALCGLNDRLKPGVCPNHYSLSSSDGLANCRLGMDLAELHFSIPKLLTPEDLTSPEVDELSIMTYLSYFFRPWNDQVLQWIQKTIPQNNIKNLTTDWNSGVNLGALADACFPGICSDWKKMDPTNATQNLERLFSLIDQRIGVQCPISAAEFADPKVDEIIVATYLSGFKNAKLKASPEEFTLRLTNLKNATAFVQKPVKIEIDVNKGASGLASEIKASVHGPTVDTPIVLAAKSDSMLEGTFLPAEPGEFEIFAIYAGHHILGSPCSFNAIDPQKCQVLGRLPSAMQVGQTYTVTISTHEAGPGELSVAFGESLKESSVYVTVKSIEDKGETHDIELLAETIGDENISIRWDESNIPQTPFNVKVCDANKVQATGHAIMTGKGRAGEAIKFTVHTSGAGSLEPTIVPRGKSAMYKPEISPDGKGNYMVSFVPWEVGNHSIEIMLGDQHINGSPFSIAVDPSLDADSCSATGEGLSLAFCGRKTTFQINSPDPNLLQKKRLTTTITSPKQNIPVTLADEMNGTYIATYTPTVLGEYLVNVKMGEKHINGSPFPLEVVLAPNAAKCRAYGPALDPKAVHIAGNPIDLFIDTNQAGHGELEVNAEGPKNASAPKLFVAQTNEVYSLKFDAPDHGTYYINALWSGVAIPKSPFKIAVRSAPNASLVKAYGPGLQSGVLSGEPAEFAINTKGAGVGKMVIRVHGVKGAFRIECAPDESNPRLLKASYNPQASGDYTISIRWSGAHIPGSPFQVYIRIDEDQDDEDIPEPSPLRSTMHPSKISAHENVKKTKTAKTVKEEEESGVTESETSRKSRKMSTGQTYPASKTIEVEDDPDVDDSDDVYLHSPSSPTQAFNTSGFNGTPAFKMPSRFGSPGIFAVPGTGPAMFAVQSKTTTTSKTTRVSSAKKPKPKM
eukprot:Em0010g739a